jgi:hypothetical protein
MSKATRKEIFTVLGTIQRVEDRHRFIPNSPGHMSACVSRIPLGKPVSCTFYDQIPTRSEGQLAYHWVLMGHIATHTGYTKDEVHDAIMRKKFGTKKIKLAGMEIEVRKSVSDKARFPKSDMVELISYDREICDRLEIVVPTAEELGYISNYSPMRPYTPIVKEKKK